MVALLPIAYCALLVFLLFPCTATASIQQSDADRAAVSQAAHSATAARNNSEVPSIIDRPAGLRTLSASSILQAALLPAPAPSPALVQPEEGSTRHLQSAPVPPSAVAIPMQASTYKRTEIRRSRLKAGRRQGGRLPPGPGPWGGVRFERMFVFGDSLSDTGNNNFGSPGFYRADFPPYGQNFVPSSGRFCDGRLVVDYLGTFLG